MKGTFYIVGTGPGDPGLITLKAVGILRKCRVWFVPSSTAGGERSVAFDIAAQAVATDDKVILRHYFPMKKVSRGEQIDAELEAAWMEGARILREQLDAGVDVVFPTLGDPSIYSTSFYIVEILTRQAANINIEIVPGIPAIAATAAAAKIPLCLGNERIVIVPATFEDAGIEALLQRVEAVAFMKAGTAMDRLVPLLERLDAVENAVLIECCGFPEQRVWNDIREAVGKKLHYFSTMIVRLPGRGRD